VVDVFYITHPAFARHDTGAWHPERPARLQAVQRGVDASSLPVETVEAPVVDRSLLELVHRPRYIDAIRKFIDAGGGALDPDTVAGPESWDAALRSAGAGPAAVDLLRDRSDTTAFLAVRPPGHHALIDRAMGFCLFNNVAVTAAMLRRSGERVAIVDWDVHHGNGTQDTFRADPDVLYVSLHQHPFYPGGGEVHERGEGAGEGYVVNVPVPGGTGGDVYRSAFERIVAPVVAEFAPDWILVSAGYDAHEDDPLAEIRLRSADYRVMAATLSGILPVNRIVTFLEGGYHLPAISASVASTLRGLAGLESEDDTHRTSSSAGWEALEAAVAVARRSWDVG
jgi:acetoin utilization deacetylase AcuC-like enzyme